ncbi:MAG TPA: DUF4389 domain-containing protein [Gemmatimonadales bacterium]|nr:DUF4389 domain-containing protein [Gemmatimonadales bacterium]
MTTVEPPRAGWYSAALEIDYPDRELNRLTSFFRPVLFIPIGILLALLSGPTTLGEPPRPPEGTDPVLMLTVGAGGILTLPTALMLVFRQKYPRWWFDWNLELTGFTTRCLAYLALLRDEYPSTDEEQAVHLDLWYPDAATDLNRWLPLVKWLLAIPHYIVLAFLWIAAAVCVVAAWFAILFTGRYPRGLFEFVTGVFRWTLRVWAYAFLLTTDRYPPFSPARLPANR